MTEDEVAAQARAYRTAQSRFRRAQSRTEAAKAAQAQAWDDSEAARVRLGEAIVRAIRAGDRQTEVARRAGLSREAVRRLSRAAGVEPAD